jgi:hypothetical protein
MINKSMEMRKLLNLMESVIAEESFDLEKYAKPEGSGETNLYKGIPIEYRDHPDVKNAMKYQNLRIRYRGPSTSDYKRPQNHTIKDKATSFTLYKKDQFDDDDYRLRYVNRLHDIVRDTNRYGDHTTKGILRNKALEMLNKLAQRYPDVM